MKNLSLFVTLSLVTLMGTCTIVKANPAEDNLEQYQDSVILSQADEVLEEETVEVPEEETLEVLEEETVEVPEEETVEVPEEETTP